MVSSWLFALPEPETTSEDGEMRGVSCTLFLVD
jgi:hypothetical protein